MKQRPSKRPTIAKLRQKAPNPPRKPAGHARNKAAHDLFRRAPRLPGTTGADVVARIEKTIPDWPRSRDSDS